jgi:hypothetical protein
MRKLKIPGFTAEASAYTTSNTYQGVYGASSPSQQIEGAADCTCTSWYTPPPVCTNWDCPPKPTPPPGPTGCPPGQKCCGHDEFGNCTDCQKGKVCW